MKKVRKRYLLFKLHREGPHIDSKRLVTAIRESLLSLYGEIKVADSKIFLNDYDDESGQGIIQCNADLLDCVISATAVLASIDDTCISFQPKKTSGTLKGLKR